MKSALLLVCFCLGISASSVKTSATNDEQVTTTVSMSLVAKTVSATSITRFHRNANDTKGTSPAPDIVPISITDVSVIEKPSPARVGDNLANVQKMKSKILISNLKNNSDLLVLPNDKKTKKPTIMHAVVNITEGYATVDEDGNVRGFIVKNEKTTAITEIQMNHTVTENDFKKKKDGFAEGRSLESDSLQQNTTTNLKKRLRVPPSVTERSTYKFGLFGEPHKFQTGNRVLRPQSTVALPGKKLTPVSPDNKFNKNAIRFESSSQTDWKPLVPERLSMRPMSAVPHDFTKLKPVFSEKANKTLDKDAIVFPSEEKLQKESNFIPFREVEMSRTTEQPQKNNIEKIFKDAEKTQIVQNTSRLPVRFRGAIRYKSNHVNESSLNGRKHQKKIIYNKTHGMDNLEMEIPATGASWTLATLKNSVPVKTSEIMKETLIPNLPANDTSQVTESQKSSDNGVVVLPANIKMENITKESKMPLFDSKSEMMGTKAGTLDVRPSMSGSIPPFKLLKNWNSKKLMKDEPTGNETEVIIPESIEISQSSDSTPFMDIIKVSLPQVEMSSVDVTTENLIPTTSVLESGTVSNSFKLTTTTPATMTTTTTTTTAATPGVHAKELLKFTSQNVTYENAEDISSDVSSTTEFFATTLETLPTTSDSATLPPFLKTSASEETEGEEGEFFTEPKPMSLPQEESRIPFTNSSAPEVGAADGLTIKADEKNETSINPIYSTTTLPVITRPLISLRKEVIMPLPTLLTAIETTTLSPLATTEAPRIASSKPFDEMQMTPVKNIAKPLETNASTNASTKSEKTVAQQTQMQETTTEDSVMPFTQPSSSVSNAFLLLTTTTHTVPNSMVSTVSTSTSFASNASASAPLTVASSELNLLTTSPSPITTANYKLVKPETTEESVYYENFVPTTISFHDEITEENVPAYLRLTVQTASWTELCAQRKPLREAIIKMLNGENFTSESIHFLNLSDKNCQEKIEETKGVKPNGTIFLPVNMFLMDRNRDFDKNLSEAFLTKWGRDGLDFDLPIRKVDFVTPIVNLTELYEPPLGGSVIAAIVISCVAGICVILLGILFVIMKRRQKRFNYGQRCTPVSLDAYSLDSVSIYNSVRRKGMRASKRSYGNAAFDDPEVPSHPMNFAGLANFSSGKEQLYEEFSIIPQVHPKVEELPEKAETKNRYANVIPLPETRVHLTVRNNDPLSDYINANYVRGLKGAEKVYIACQAPMESTIEDFWRMIWEQQCKVIMMITDLQENGIEKCADYLPPSEVTDNLRLFGDYQVTLKKRDVKDKYIISNLTLKNMDTNLWREVTHLWYLGWPEQGVPTEANSLIAFLIEARSQMKIQSGTTAPPAVVHCSPGTGRTGTVIACDLCIKEYEQSRMVDIPKCVFNLRRDRAGAVQTKDQYAFIYEVLNIYATKLTGGGIESI